jgi:hypothetical protein
LIEIQGILIKEYDVYGVKAASFTQGILPKVVNLLGIMEDHTIIVGG